MTRLARLIDLLGRLGPRPGLVARYVAHGVATRARRRLLRRTYARTIASPRERATLVLVPVELPSFEDLPPRLRAAAERLRAEAESVLAHRFDLLGSGPAALGERIDWQRDFKSGYRWPLVYYADVETVRLTDASDAKVPWELSRCHHLLTLALAARIFDDERLADELEDQLTQWLAENPPGYGINWANPMEVALRAVNWVAALATLEPWRPLRDPLRADVTRSIQVHARHIAANLEGTPYLRGNHYLADVLGLLVIGASLAGDRHSERWFHRAHAALEREIRAQTHEDGVGFEASLPYHVLALEMLVAAKTTADHAGHPFSGAFEARLLAMLEASRAVRHPDGRLPQIGDGDSGRVLTAGFDRPPTADAVLALAAATLGTKERPTPEPPHEEVAWLRGVAAWQALAHRPAGLEPTRRAFPAAGFYVLRGTRAHVVVRCGDVGQNGNGGHAHNDVLSFELSHGRPLVVDSGTYAYTSDPAARNEFRSTAAHNTVVVAGAEINPIRPTELFRLKRLARPSVELWEETPARVRLVASHDGYRRLAPGVVHRRSFVLERHTDALEIVDELIGDGRQRAESFLHLAPDVNAAEVGDGKWELRCGDLRCSIRLDGIGAVRLDEGAVSDRFGRREPAPILVAEVEGELPLRFGCRIVPSLVPAVSEAAAAGP